MCILYIFKVPRGSAGNKFEVLQRVCGVKFPHANCNWQIVKLKECAVLAIGNVNVKDGDYSLRTRVSFIDIGLLADISLSAYRAPRVKIWELSNVDKYPGSSIRTALRGARKGST